MTHLQSWSEYRPTAKEKTHDFSVVQPVTDSLYRIRVVRQLETNVSDASSASIFCVSRFSSTFVMDCNMDTELTLTGRNVLVSHVSIVGETEVADLTLH
jgi:hypothetical protein